MSALRFACLLASAAFVLAGLSGPAAGQAAWRVIAGRATSLGAVRVLDRDRRLTFKIDASVRRLTGRKLGAARRSRERSLRRAERRLRARALQRQLDARRERLREQRARQDRIRIQWQRERKKKKRGY